MRICRLTFLFGALAVVTAFFFVGCSKKTEPVTEPGVAVETPPAEAREIEAEPTTDATLASSADEEELIELKPLEYDKDTLFLWRCDGATTDEKGVASTEGATEYDDGIFDRAMVCNDENHPSYPANDVANASEGTIEFWFKPTLDRAGDTAREQWCFVELGFRFNNGVIIVVDGLNNYRAIFWGDNPATAEVERNWETGVILHNVVSWKAGEWLHIATTWDASGAQALYLNGEQVDSINNGVYISDFASDSKLTINSRREPARGLIDEFRVSKVARSASEIAKDYKRGYDPDRRVDVKRPLERRPSASVSNGPFRVRACEGGAEIVGLNGDFSDAELVIPETVVVKSAAGENLDAPVVQIAERAFRQRKSLTSVVLPASVTKIGSYAFSDCSSLASVELPDGLTEIGGYAFSMCKSLETIALPKGLKKIGKWAFSGCEALTAIELPEGATEIEENTFSRCKSLKSVALSKETTEIDDSAFYNCESLTSIAIPDGVTKIGDYAFYGCDLLAKVAVPTSVAKLGQDAFPTKTEIMRGVETASETEGASESSADVAQVAFKARTDYKGGAEILGIDGEFVGGTLVIPETVPLKNNWDEEVETPVKKIGGYAFSSNKSLRSVFIPKGTEVIDESAFSGCAALTSVKLPDGLKNIRIKAFADCDSLETVWVPESVETLAKTAFPKTTEIKRGIDPDYDATAREIAAATKDASADEEPFDEDGSIAENAFPETTEIKRGVDPDVATSAETTEATSISDSSIIPLYTEDPTEPTRAPVFSFWGRQVTEASSNVAGVEITEIRTTQPGTPFPTLIEIPDSLFILKPDGAAVKLPVVGIAAAAFADCEGLKQVSIPPNVFIDDLVAAQKSVQLIMGVAECASETGEGAAAFRARACDGGAEIIGFDGAPGETVVVPATIVVKNDSGREEEVPVVKIGEEAFKGCFAARVVTLPGGLREIADGALNYLFSLESIVLSDDNPNFKLVDDVLFTKDGKKLLKYPASKKDEEYVVPDGVVEIAVGAFAWNMSLATIKLPDELKEIGDGVFGNFPALRKIVLSDDNPNFETVDDVLFTKDGKKLLKYPASKKDGEYVVPAGVVEIAVDAFAGNTSLTTIELPDELKEIGDGAFANCLALGKFVLSDNNPAFKAVDDVLFTKDGKKLLKYPASKKDEEYVVPSGVVEVDDGAFDNCASLTTIGLPKGLSEIGESAFAGCDSLKSIAIPEGTTEIKEAAFVNCKSLETVSFPKGLKEIDDFAFNGCESLNIDSLVLPEGLEHIGDFAFIGCRGSAPPLPDGVTTGQAPFPASEAPCEPVEQ